MFRRDGSKSRTNSSLDQFEDEADSRHGHLRRRCLYRTHADFLARRRAMAEPKKSDETVTKQFESGVDPDNSLLPMLIGGLVLIVIGAIIVMMFV
jgi:hypothetical protein